MASEPTAPAPAAADVNTFTLQLKLPSDGVLLLNDLSFATTVKQLKEQIRNAHERKPSDETQRLIHRGRLLMRENETMLELFGQEAVCAASLLPSHAY
jgi:hypothetical protein